MKTKWLVLKVEVPENACTELLSLMLTYASGIRLSVCTDESLFVGVKEFDSEPEVAVKQ